eukprot:884359-Pyramimonas_sp.AAC.1
MPKTQIWPPEPHAAPPPQCAHYGQYRVDQLMAAGSTLAHADHDVDANLRDVPLAGFRDARGVRRGGVA